jgi:CRP-like cAMP-binding protein
MDQAPPIRHAAWIARCLGRGELAPLRNEDIEVLAGELTETRHAGGTELYGRQVTLQLLRAGDVFGDIPVIAHVPLPFDARALEASVVLSIDAETLWRILEQRPRLARRWMVSIALRMAEVQARLVAVAGGAGLPQRRPSGDLPAPERVRTGR